MKSGEETEVCDLVALVFNEFVAPQYLQEGIDEFFRYVRPDLLSARLQANHFVLVAELEGRLIGTIEVRNYDHISLFFVDKGLQRTGIGKELWRQVLALCLATQPDLTKITVNSSPNAMKAYERLGFQVQGPEKTVNGIRFVPMTLDVGQGDGS